MDDESKEIEFPVEYMFKDVPDDIDEDADPVAVVLGEMDHFGIERGDGRRALRAQHLHPSHPGAPRPVLRLASRSAQPRHGRRARPREGLRDARHQGGHRLPGRDDPAGADQRQAVLPDLRQVHRARHPDLRLHRRPRPAGADGLPEDRADRRGLLVLPRAEVRDAPRRRAVGRPRREAHAQVAEPLLLHSRVRAALLPADDHRLRQHPRRRQGDVRRLLPDGPDARAHLLRDARRAVQGRVWPKFLRENAVRVFELDA